MKWEDDVKNLIQSLYIPTSPYALYGANSLKHFNALLVKLDRLVEDTLCSAFSQYTIIQIVDEFLRAVRENYMTQ